MSGSETRRIAPWMVAICLLAAAPGAAQLAVWEISGSIDSANPLPATTSEPGTAAGDLLKSAALTPNVATDVFQASGWPSGPLDLTRYFEFSVAANAGFEIAYQAVRVTVRGPGTLGGGFDWQIRSSVDGFAAALDAGSVNFVGGATVEADVSSLGSLPGNVSFRVYLHESLGFLGQVRGFAGSGAGGVGLQIDGIVAWNGAWVQVNEDGFGDPTGYLHAGCSTFRGAFYCGTQTRLMRSSDGTSWTEVSTTTGSPGAEFGGQLYVSVGAPGGGIVRTPDGITFEPLASTFPTFGDDQLIQRPQVFDNRLYAGTFKLPTQFTGGEVWSSPDAITWTQVNEDGFGDDFNSSVEPGAVFRGQLYLGTWKPGGGGELWRSADGTTWTQVNEDGFGDVDNRRISPGVVFDGHLYVGTRYNPAGGGIWRSADGTTWTQVNAPGFGSPDNYSTSPAAILRGRLYAVTENSTTGTEVWSSADGTSWQQESAAGFGDSDNVGGFAYAFGGRLFVGADKSGFVDNGVEFWASHPAPQATCFTSPVVHPTAAGSAAVTAADLDGDLVLDLATADFTAGSASVLLGNGDGSFQPADSYPTVPPVTLPTDVVAVDVDADRIPDLLVTNRTSDVLSVHLGNGDDSFQAAVSYPTGLGPAALAVADLDGDAFLDVVTANFSGDEIGVLRGNGAGGFGPSTGYSTGALGLGPFDLALGDVDGDGDLDAVVGNSLTSYVSVLPGNGDGSFGAATTYLAGSGPESLALADLEGDGDLDIVTANVGSGDVSTLRGNGDGSFQAPIALAVGTSPAGVALRDVNADAVPDALVALSGDAALAVLLGNGDGSFQAPQSFDTSPSTPLDVTAADLDGDAAPELIAADFDGNVITLGNCAAFADSDGDGLADSVENPDLGTSVDPGETDPGDRDSDDDGLADGAEDVDRDGVVDPGETDPRSPDTDGDGLQDGTEIGETQGVADPDGAGPLQGTDAGVFVPDADPASTTDPLDPDSDGDGLPDGSSNSEDLNDNGRVDPGETDPRDRDTDDDGFDDGVEVAAGSDPLDPTSTPIAVPALGPAAALLLAATLGLRGARRLRRNTPRATTP